MNENKRRSNGSEMSWVFFFFWDIDRFFLDEVMICCYLFILSSLSSGIS